MKFLWSKFFVWNKEGHLIWWLTSKIVWSDLKCRLYFKVSQPSFQRIEDNSAYGILEHLIDTHVYKQYEYRKQKMPQSGVGSMQGKIPGICEGVPITSARPYPACSL